GHAPRAHSGLGFRVHVHSLARRLQAFDGGCLASASSSAPRAGPPWDGRAAVLGVVFRVYLAALVATRQSAIQGYTPRTRWTAREPRRQGGGAPGTAARSIRTTRSVLSPRPAGSGASSQSFGKAC